VVGTLATGGLTSAYTKGTSVSPRNKRTGRRSGGLLMFGAALAATGLLLTVAPGVAAAADPQKAAGLIAKASVSIMQGRTAQAARIPDRATAICIPGADGENRFFSCVPLIGEVIFYVEEDGVLEPVGDITFQVEQTDELAVKSTTVTETDYIYDIAESGETAPDGLAVVVTCGTGCRGAAHGPVALTEGKTYLYTLHFANSIGKNAVRSNTPRYSWEFTIGNPETTSGRAWRCDDKLNEAAGCVYASFVPTVSMAGLKFIAASIRTIQAHGGPRQLHRNSFLTTPNRNAVCRGVPSPGWKPPAGWPLPVNKPGGANKPQCDEYPFAATWEGGTRLPKGQRGVAVVPAGENRSQGGRLNTFYLANRVLNASSAKTKGDAFNVAA
jgi:Deoxyribonuclease NucA/NucB